MKNTIGIKIIVLIASSILFTNCKLPKASIKRQEIDKDKGALFWAQYDATRRGSMIFVDPENRIRVLAENPPDVAMQSITELSAKIKVIDKVDIALALKTQQTIAELGKRTASVNMLRDALYRINEMYYSTRDEKSEILKKVKTFKELELKILEEKAKVNFEGENSEILAKLKGLEDKLKENAKERVKNKDLEILEKLKKLEKSINKNAVVNSKGENSEILAKLKDLEDKLKENAKERVKNKDLEKSTNKNSEIDSETLSLLKPTLSADSISMLFKLVINNAKEIAIKEASANISIEKSKSKAIIEEQKLKQLKIELLNKIFTKGTGSLSKEEKELYDQILKL